jgi:FkbM family methyltransferase
MPVYRRIERSLQLRMQQDLPFNAIPIKDDLCIYSPDHLLCYRIFSDMASETCTRIELAGFLRLAKGCACLLDVGASAGYFSSIFAQMCAVPAKVVSVEPEAKSFQLLQESRRLNSRHGVDWLILNCGVAEADRIVKFKGGPQLGTTVDESDPDGVDIKCMTLSSICREAGVRPDLMKLDIESYEYEVLMSSTDFLGDIKPRLHLELHSPELRQRGLDPGDLLRRLDALGYFAHGESTNKRVKVTSLLREYEVQRLELSAN